MARLRATAVLLASLASLATGCLYMQESVQLKHRPDRYENYPTTLEANAERRAKRRTHALIAAPIELAVGTLLLAAAKYAPGGSAMSEPSSEPMSYSWTDGFGGGEAVWRVLVGSLGLTAFVSGVGDTVGGLASPLLPNSLERDGKLVDASEIDHMPPPTTLRPTVGMDLLLSVRGFGGDVSFGMSRWLTPSVRLNGNVVGEWVFPFSEDVRGSLYGQVEIERAFGREYLGLYPRHALGIYAFAGPSVVQDHDADGAILGGGLSARLSLFRYRAGISFIPHVDDKPMFCFSMGGDLQLE